MDRALSVAEGYSFCHILPEPFIDLGKLPRRVQSIGNTDGFGKIRPLINSEILSNEDREGMGGFLGSEKG